MTNSLTSLKSLLDFHLLNDTPLGHLINVRTNSAFLSISNTSYNTAPLHVFLLVFFSFLFS